MIPLTPEQASAIATVQAAGKRRSVDYYDGFMRFLGFDPRMQNTDPQQQALLERMYFNNDLPFGARLVRLKTQRHVYEIVYAFADYDPTRAAPLNYLGTSPTDRAGQRVLMHALIGKVPLHTIAEAFSVPFSELGMLLLEGEQIALIDGELALRARKAVATYFGGL